jgi:nitrite reductase/ring-hydroxylating ferredoxin subunit/uncharacterized membrane protein
MFTRRKFTTQLADQLPWLDKAATILKSVSDPILGKNGPQRLKDTLYGTWLGHPLHPLATDLPIGFWTSSMMLDLAGKEQAADLTLKLGTISALGAAASGLAQWHDLQEMKEPRRLGALHATLNIAATGLYATSWCLRANDARDAARTCSTLAYGIATASAWIGGDLSFRLGIGVSRIAFEEPRKKWTTVLPETELETGKLTRVEAGGVPIMLLKQDDRILAVSATCTHVGAPLNEGTIEEGCVVCPWHGSHFDLASGHVVHGPAVDDLRQFEVRIENGNIQVRPAA